MMRWLKRLLGWLEVETVCVPWAEGEKLLDSGQGWRISPLEDNNCSHRVVWLERDKKPEPH